MEESHIWFMVFDDTYTTMKWSVMCTYDVENILGLCLGFKRKETTITIINICAKYFFFFSHSTKKMTPFFIPHNGNKSNYKSPSTSFAFEVFIIVGKIIFLIFFCKCFSLLTCVLLILLYV